MATGAIYTVKIPNRLGGMGVVLFKETATILAGEDASKAPWGVIERLDIGDVDNKKISRLCALNVKWARQVVDFGEIDVSNIIGAVIVADLTTSPI